MAQTALTITAIKANNAAISAGDLLVTEAAADAVNGNSFTLSGKEVLIVHNTDAAPHTFTLTSIADHLGRTGDIANYSVAANAIAAIQMNTVEGWRNSSGLVTMTASSNLLKFAVLRLN